MTARESAGRDGSSPPELLRHIDRLELLAAGLMLGACATGVLLAVALSGAADLVRLLGPA